MLQDYHSKYIHTQIEEVEGNNGKQIMIFKTTAIAEKWRLTRTLLRYSKMFETLNNTIIVQKYAMAWENPQTCHSIYTNIKPCKELMYSTRSHGVVTIIYVCPVFHDNIFLNRKPTFSLWRHYCS